MELSNVSVLDTRRKILLNTPHIDTSVGDLATFNTDLSAPLKSCKVSFLPVQEGEGDPSPDNVRNITGWNGVNVSHTNANLLMPDDPSNTGATYKMTATKKMLYDEVEQGFYTDPNTDGVAYRKCNDYDYVSFVAPSDMTVTFSLKYKKLSGSDNQYRFRLYKVLEMPSSKTVEPPQTQLLKTWGNQADAFDEWLDGSYTVTLNKGEGLYLLMYSWIMWKDLALVVGDSGISYEDGIQNSYSVDWTDSAGTVYGGYVDLVSEELVAEYVYMTDTWGNWGTLSDCGDGTELRYKKFTNKIVGNSAGQSASYCNVAKYSYNNANGKIHFYNVASSNNCRIYLPSGTDESLQIQVVGKLVEPIHYQLTHQQLSTLKGTNNVYSDTNGQMEIKYWKH